MNPEQALQLLAAQAQQSMPISRLQEFNNAFNAIVNLIKEHAALLAEKEAPPRDAKASTP
jgi:hypothetical protein